MALQSKMTVYAALAGVFALLGGIIYNASLDNEHLEQAGIALAAVELREADRLANQAKYDVTFLVSNPSEKTFTVSLISYDLSGDGVSLGSGQYSTADIALPGRAVFSQGAEIPLKSTFVLKMSEVGETTYNDMVDGSIGSFSAKGILTTETSWSIVEKEFSTELG